MEETGEFPKDSDIFEATRTIVIAMMQKVVYGEWLPAILGREFVENPRNNLDLPMTGTTYDSNVNPTIENGFATAAFRFGHSMIQGLIEIRDHNSNEVLEEARVRDDFFNAENFVAPNGVDNLIFGLTQQPAARMDELVTEDVTNHLFQEPGSDHGGDLVARNIQRGRDHGLPSYVAFYDKYFGDSKTSEDMDCWGHRPSTISEANWDVLRTIYEHPHHIDLFVGGLAETPVSGGLTGPVFNAIKLKQFYNLMFGDRFFFTHKDQPFSFTKDAQKHIMDRKLSDILCENTSLEKIPQNAFKLHDQDDNRYKTCSTSVTELDLGKINLL